MISFLIPTSCGSNISSIFYRTGRYINVIHPIRYHLEHRNKVFDNVVWDSREKHFMQYSGLIELRYDGFEVNRQFSMKKEECGNCGRNSIFYDSKISCFHCESRNKTLLSTDDSVRIVKRNLDKIIGIVDNTKNFLYPAFYLEYMYDELCVKRGVSKVDFEPALMDFTAMKMKYKCPNSHKKFGLSVHAFLKEKK